MKRLLPRILLLSLLMTACSDDEKRTEPVSAEPNQTEQDNKIDEEQLEADNKKFKADSKEYSFVELNGDEVDKMTKIKLVGEVKFVQGEGTNQTFKLGTTEGDGFGIFSVKNYSGDNVTDGEQITMYGTYNGKSDLSEPEVVAILIE